ncbi:hypothetical protein RZP29_23040 [Klebsiella quasipneumoniae subsp. similipneumoniae]|uniref:Uncharacterized protein n=1 Tax=Klebsiella quasipneumoniae subsp. similipneumoniae TaxID=1463164 RepID=A0AAE4MUT4_9ENTR|nr:hypothetical protein [Klebsiella quasipneumoniae]MDV0613188.1 hypothetical protein [Klebsiella quasipneumoniae subsp. similipneumoniae]MDV0640914.1 hypothetical protein [Klebsiella quasipneumoniae subsp. similipneumoniae]MDV0727980.1 hypothetical protein [Klebsiella quasipneumoniae subsp. similipneumoniae]MDV0739644.1 hypothetical protein [Klebsiella quasipneumoniae subsp. similipneumoniae]MDV0765640.1 hypothetical protein [Klebsiella quasipneumoniae subsp. similipneumoniae]
MNIEAVNELIASLESAGELSIREQKFLKLAKAHVQLAAENVALKKSAPAPFSKLMMEALDTYHSKADDVPELAMLSAYVKLRDGLKTPATDRIVAGIKAEAKSHDLNAFISHYSAELDNHIANGGDQFDERAVRLRGVIVGARMFREKLRDEEKALALREGDGK